MKYWTRQYIAGSHGDESSARSLEATVDVPFPMVVFASASAGALASWVTSPLDMAKLRLQVQRGNLAENPGQSSHMYRGVVDCLRLTYREGGLKGLFRGAGARVLHFTPAMTITMTCYEACRSFLAESLHAG
jgi:solute carrier family 25 thiamine pyrophosphate transporter 19